MIVKTLFRQGRRFEPGEVEISLLPGVPNLHIVGLPDAQIRECGIRLKAALRASGLSWPQGHQIVVNLRPNHFRKTGAGVDLAIALGFLKLTGQVKDGVKSALQESLIYGEVGLDGKITRPFDTEIAIRCAGVRKILTGAGEERYGDGEWLEIESLSSEVVTNRRAQMRWSEQWQRPALPNFELCESAVTPLLLSLHMKLNVLLAGPQGSGKSTWAQIFYALTPSPDLTKMRELFDLFPHEVGQMRWRPFEQPHHTITVQAMVGGGLPLAPGVVSRAHGGVLVMDEFLEFHPQVLEALREPLEVGSIEIARKGVRERIHADFHLIGTTNLCPCGKLNPLKNRSCSRSLPYCRSVCDRLSGPLLDRFDLLVLTADWLKAGHLVPVSEVAARLERLGEFSKKRGPLDLKAPPWVHELELSHRRKRSLMAVARGLADMDECLEVTPQHICRAQDMVVHPVTRFGQFFA